VGPLSKQVGSAKSWQPAPATCRPSTSVLNLGRLARNPMVKAAYDTAASLSTSTQPDIAILADASSTPAALARSISSTFAVPRAACRGCFEGRRFGEVPTGSG